MDFPELSPQLRRQHEGISFTGIVTTFQCHDTKGRLLFAKRGPQARDERGTWDVGAGGLEWGSTAEDNVRREIGEEYGANCRKIEFWGYRDVFRQTEGGTPTHWIGLDFGVLVDPATVKNNEPKAVAEIGWFTLSNLPKPLHSQMPRIIKLYPKQYEQIAALGQ